MLRENVLINLRFSFLDRSSPLCVLLYLKLDTRLLGVRDTRNAPVKVNGSVMVYYDGGTVNLSSHPSSFLYIRQNTCARHYNFLPYLSAIG